MVPLKIIPREHKVLKGIIFSGTMTLIWLTDLHPDL